MNHNNTQGVIDLHRELSTNASVYGLPYELGETGSLSVSVAVAPSSPGNPLIFLTELTNHYDRVMVR